MSEDLEAIRRQRLTELRDRAGNETAGGPDAETPSEPVAVDSSAELTETVDEHRVVLVDFYADWCGPCQLLEPVVETLAAETDAVVAKVDVDANQELAAQHSVRGVPTLVLFADGQPVERLVGMQPETRLRSVVEDHT